MTTNPISAALNAVDRAASTMLGAVGLSTCQHEYGPWTKPLENRADKVGAFKIIKRDAILLSTTKHRFCTKCGNRQTNTVAAK